MIQLLTFGPEDFDQLISWAPTPEILLQFAGPDFDFPLTHGQLAQSIKTAGRHSYKVVESATVESIGHAEIVVSNKNAHLCRILIGDERLRGRGVGRKIVHELLRKSFGELECKTASLYVYDWNKSAVQCYRKEGFTVSEEERKVSKIGNEQWLALRMINDREKWKAIQERAD
jgi:RimJ/RimL family protein N-acetyltransferase